MKIKDIKEKISKRKLKITPLILALAFTLGTLIPVVPAEAKETPVYARVINNGEYYSGGFDYIRDGILYVKLLEIGLMSYESDVYFICYRTPMEANEVIGLAAISARPFVPYVATGEFSTSDTSLSYRDYSTGARSNISASSSGNVYYYKKEFIIPYECFRSCSEPLVPTFDKSIIACFESILTASGQIGTETIETNYAGSSTAEILPPQNVSFYNDKSYNAEDGITQIQWDSPNDENLMMEISCEVYWRDGVFSKKNYDNYVWKSYDTSDINGTYHKYSFRQNQPCLDYFTENNIDTPKFYNVTYWYLRWARCDNEGNVTYSLWTKLDPEVTLDPEYHEDGNIIEEIGGNTTLFGKDIGDNSTWAETGEFDNDTGSWFPKKVIVDSNTGKATIVDGSDKIAATSPGLDSYGNNIQPSQKELTDIIPENFGDVFNSFNDYLESAWDFLGDFPSYLGDLMSFLPSGIPAMIGLGIVMAVMLRLLGR